MSDREKGGTVDIVHGRKNDDSTETLIPDTSYIMGEAEELAYARPTPNPLTDKQKLEDLLTSFGVAFDVVMHNGNTSIVCEEGMSKVVGLGGYTTAFEFNDQDGSFIEMGAWV